MKKSSKEDAALIKAPLPPSFRMIDDLVNLLPKIEKQQKATIKYFKAEVKAMNQFIKAMDSIRVKASFPKPPLIPMLAKFIKVIPDIEKFQKELIKFYSGSAKRMVQFEKDLK
jgi:hypothetical protein